MYLESLSGNITDKLVEVLRHKRKCDLKETYGTIRDKLDLSRKGVRSYLSACLLVDGYLLRELRENAWNGLHISFSCKIKSTFFFIERKKSFHRAKLVKEKLMLVYGRKILKKRVLKSA